MDLYYLGRPDQPGNFGLTASVPNLTIRATWATVEPESGTFNWAHIDAGVRAAGNNKIALTINTGLQTPSWVQCQKITGKRLGGSVSYPVPWDPNYVAGVNALAAAAGARYGDLLKLDRVTISYLCTQTPETYLDSSGITLEQWQAVGYSHTLAQSTFKDGITAVTEAFPKTNIVAAWMPGNGGLSFDTAGGKACIGQLHNWFNLQGQVIAMNCGANASWVMPLTAPPEFVYQTSGPLGGAINQCIARSQTAGAAALEVYPPDVPSVS